MTGVEYREITGDGVAIIDKDGKAQTIEADTVVLAAGAKPNTGLLRHTKNIKERLYTT